MNTFRLAIVMVIGAALLLGAPTWSEAKKGKHKKEEEVVEITEKTEMAETVTISIEQAIALATQKVPGTVIAAELEKQGDKTVWEVEIVSADGMFAEIYIDAEEDSAEEQGEGKETAHEEKETEDDAEMRE